MAEYKPVVNQKKGYEPHGNETSKRVGELQKHLDNFNKTSVAGATREVPKQIIVVKN